MNTTTKLCAAVFLFSAACTPQTEEKEIKEFVVAGKSVTIYETAETTELRLSPTGTRAFQPSGQPRETEIAVFVNPQKTFQTFLGIGGAITDASAEVYARLSPEKQQAVLKAYYDKDEGIGYSLMRTNIHSCDFSSGSYTYVEEGDSSLNSFSIEHDLLYRIPMIKEAIQTAGGAITLYASPWSPPAFMKDSKNMLFGGKLLPEYARAWARYYVRFIQEYERNGIPVWGLSVQNEPMAVQTWESCIYTAEEERDFLKNHLGPVLVESGMEDKKIIVWDHNRDLITHRANTILGDPEAARYVWGVGFHWYETWTGGAPMFQNIRNVQESYPDVNLIFTEGCAESFRDDHYHFWPNAERYGENMINDFNNGTVGWTDWNILLDQQGGPNHVGNFCFAPVHAHTETGEIIYTPSYYYIGHFSKFIRPGAVRVSTTTMGSHLQATSFLNTDDSMVTVVMNKTDEKLHYKLMAGAYGVEQDILPHSIQTFVY